MKKIDLHIHSKYSDGELCISPSIVSLFEGYDLVSFADHEHIFDPAELQRKSDSTKFISGVEICCHYENQNIEILGYNFDVNNLRLNRIVDKVGNLREFAIKKILLENSLSVEIIPQYPFRINVPLPNYIDAVRFWKENDSKYKAIYHSVSADDVIEAIVTAHGVPVLAHPMESLYPKSKNEVERFIQSLGIQTIELFTPKHDAEDVAIIKDIILRNNLSGSIGSDSHKSKLAQNPYEYNINERKFKWIQEILK